MHMDGLINRNNYPIKVMHIVQILAGEELWVQIMQKMPKSS
jgi:L-lactate dehydrogenase complex protein LldE